MTTQIDPSVQETTFQVLADVLTKMPADWLGLTTHRLDIYQEKLAKTQFLDEFQKLVANSTISEEKLAHLPTAYDYIRLGHPLSCILEWAIAAVQGREYKHVISFDSVTMPLLAIARTNHFANRKTIIYIKQAMHEDFNAELVRKVYGYDIELREFSDYVSNTDGDVSTVIVNNHKEFWNSSDGSNADFSLHIHPRLGSVLFMNSEAAQNCVGELQHVRRRETIAMTPANCKSALQLMLGQSPEFATEAAVSSAKALTVGSIKEITRSPTRALLGSSGLSIQYAIMMGLLHDAADKYPDKQIKIVIPPNCYGGTNDQARRLAASLEHVEVVDLPVDGDQDMVSSVELVLDALAKQDAVPFIIAEIPTNPRVEVPDLKALRDALARPRQTAEGGTAIDPVFILDQTFCPNVHFLGERDILSAIRTISYASGSKFPSGGRCTAGYCVGNAKAASLMSRIELHLQLCENEATDLQVEILAEQLPSMNRRIKAAYHNTREFVDYIGATLPSAKINFVSEELAAKGFTPSVFSLDLPTKGGSPAEQEAYKRELNIKLINLMITEIPADSKYCVSYGQLKGCYWTIPATSTQGTTKEGDKDYIVRASLSPDLDLEKHKAVFAQFVKGL